MFSIRNSEMMVKKARIAFQSGKTKSIEFREHQLKCYLRMIKENKKMLYQALYKDLRKPKFEAYSTEIDCLVEDVELFIKNLKKWSRPEKAEKYLFNLFDDLKIYNEPYGVVLVIGAWNFPIYLTLNPLIGAIAAGNAVIIKPSELAKNCAEVVYKLISRYLDNECYQVFLGEVAETVALLKERFDYVFFTGSSAVGKKVHEACACHLTPVTLELGGKSPVYLDDSADIEVATRRILWGKFLNAGQICVGPDYLMCSKKVKENFLIHAKQFIKSFFGDDPQVSPDFGRIINVNHFNRLKGLLANAKIAIGGSSDINDRYIEPTVVVDVKLTDPLMQEEIFGPILPIIVVRDVFEALNIINNGEKPLVLYVFTKDKSLTQNFILNTSSGSVVMNDVIIQLASDGLPFGGVGNSGMGQYHGKFTYDTFVHKKSVLIRNLNRLEEKFNNTRYAPFTDDGYKWQAFLIKKRKMIGFGFLKYVLIFVFGIFFVYFIDLFKTS